MRCSPDTLQSVASSAPTDVDFRIAASRPEHRAAFRLIYEKYLDADLCEPNRFRMRVTPHQLAPTTDVFIAIGGEGIIGTLTLVRDGESGLPMEDVFSLEVSQLRAKRLRVAEACSLANRYTGARQLVEMVELYRLVAHFAIRQHVDHILAAVQPHHFKFYQRFMAFETLGDPRTYPSCGCEALPIYMDLRDIDQYRQKKNYGRFFGSSMPDERLISHPMSGADRRYFGYIVQQT